MNWYVLHVKPRWEQKVAQSLADFGFEAWCPTYVEVRQWSDRKKKVRVPYFASYVFVRTDEKNRNRVFECSSGIMRFMFWLGKPAQIRDAEMEQVKTWLEDGKLENPLVEQLEPGDMVSLKSGPLEGRQAIVEELSDRKVRLLMPELGYKITARKVDVEPTKKSA